MGYAKLAPVCRNLRKRGWTGFIEVNHETGKLTIRVKMEGAKAAHQDLKTLSGGERSFITICFLLALGSQLQAKFHCLDEFDVFMDSLSQGVRAVQPCSARWLQEPAFAHSAFCSSRKGLNRIDALPVGRMQGAQML